MKHIVQCFVGGIFFLLVQACCSAKIERVCNSRTDNSEKISLNVDTGETETMEAVNLKREEKLFLLAKLVDDFRRNNSLTEEELTELFNDFWFGEKYFKGSQGFVVLEGGRVSWDLKSEKNNYELVKKNGERIRWNGKAFSENEVVVFVDGVNLRALHFDGEVGSSLSNASGQRPSIFFLHFQKDRIDFFNMKSGRGGYTKRIIGDL